MKTRLLASVALAPLALIASVHAFAQTQPAVSAPNFTLGGDAGAAFGTGQGLATGTLAFPLSTSIGAQIGGSAGAFDGRFTGEAAGHLFWRDPSNAMVGVYGAYRRTDAGFAPNVGRIGGEAELYLSKFSLSGVAGVTFGDHQRAFAQARASLYLDDSTKVFAGYVLDDLGSVKRSVSAAAIGFEHIFPSSGMAFYAEARAGESHYRAAWAGVRFYFGGQSASDKSLIRRDREDVAPLWRFVEQKKEKVASTTTATTTTVTTTTTTSTSTSTTPTTTTSTSTTATTTTPS